MVKQNTHGIEYFENANPGNGVWKFVRVGGNYRFLENGLHCGRHESMLDSEEIPNAAGTIIIVGDKAHVIDDRSTLLNVGMTDIDFELLSQVLGVVLEGKSF